MATTRRTPWQPLLRVVGHSMSPTLHDGDLLLTMPAAGRRRGHLVVLHHQAGPRYVKRVAGVGGDVIELEAGRLRVNGRSFDGRPRLAGSFVARWTVPPGHLFVVGDNALASDDSRTWDQPFVPAAATVRVLRLAHRGPQWGRSAEPGRRRGRRR